MKCSKSTFKRSSSSGRSQVNRRFVPENSTIVAKCTFTYIKVCLPWWLIMNQTPSSLQLCLHLSLFSHSGINIVTPHTFDPHRSSHLIQWRKTRWPFIFLIKHSWSRDLLPEEKEKRVVRPYCNKDPPLRLTVPRTLTVGTGWVRLRRKKIPGPKSGKMKS